MKIYLHGIKDPVEIKVRPDICWYHDCNEPKPMHAILWQCPERHRLVFWYCSKHIGVMMELVTVDEPGGGPLCTVCGGLTLMHPVLESI